MFLKVKKDINFRTVSHGMNCKKWEIVEIALDSLNATKAYPENFDLLPCKVKWLINWEIDGIKFSKWEIFELPVNLYWMALRVYPNRFWRLSLEDYKKTLKTKKEVKKSDKKDEKIVKTDKKVKKEEKTKK